jgi:hypothetical protein
MRGRWVLLPTALVWTVAMVGVATTHATAGPGSATGLEATAVHSVSPLDSQGHLGVKYTVQHRFGAANCQSGSPTTGTTYECFTPQSPQGTFDSCWVQADTSYVICLVKPWLHNAVRLHVTRGYDDRGGFSHTGMPWGIRLGRDTRCLLDLGAVASTHGQAITYYCNNKTVLTGSVKRQHATWRVHAYRTTSRKGHPVRRKSLGLLPIAIAWYAAPSHAD